MYSGSLFDETEKVTRSNMVELLINAKECVFTVTFRKKVAVKDVEEALKAVKSDKELKAKQKELAKELTEGKLTTITGFLIKSEDKLGRSTIIDLESPWNQGFRQVDHRTVEELIIKNVKYTLKK